MTAPAGLSLSFDQASYPVGGTITATLTGTGQNTAAASRVLSGTLTDPATGESSTVQGTFMVDMPDTLDASAAETDAPITWTAVLPFTQDGQAFTGQFTGIAA